MKRKTSFVLWLLSILFLSFHGLVYAGSGKIGTAYNPAAQNDLYCNVSLETGAVMLENKPDGLYEVKSFNKNDMNASLLEKRPSIGLQAFSTVNIIFDKESGAPFVNISLTDKGRKKFYELTKANIGKPLAIVVKGKVVSMPFINSAINSKNIRITGIGTFAELTDIANNLKADMKKL